MAGAFSSGEHELGLVEFATNRRRVAEELGSPKHRRKFTSRLAHFADWDERYRLAVTSGDVLKELRARNAPDSCWIVSESSQFDARTRVLETALAETVGSGFGTVISCVPGVLAFYEGETARDRYILYRRTKR
jgi:hypothetical protein